MSWKYEKLGNLITESRIPSLDPRPDQRIRVKLNMGGVEKRPIENEIAGATKQYIRKAGQFIYGKQNFHKGAFGIIPQELNGFETSADIPSFDLREDCLPEWIFYFFKIGNRYLELEKIARGVGSKRIHPEQLSEIEIPLPETSDQRLLISKFKQIEDSGENINSELHSQLSLLKNLRKQILQDAVQGKLVPQDPNDEPASKLLERIKKEKEKLVKEKKIKLGKSLPPIKPEEIPFEIPERWVWCRLGEICTKITDGFHNTPPKLSAGIPYISATHVKSDKIDWEGCDFVEYKFHSELFAKAFPKKGELLIVNIGAGCGTPAIIDVDFEFSFKNTAILKFTQSLLVNWYLYYYFLLSKEEIYKTLTQGGLQPFLSLKILNSIIIPLPPYKEQHRIISKIEQLMQHCNELEQSITQSQEYARDLMQVELREALEQNN